MQTLAEKLDDLELKIARWKKRLRVAFNKLDKLEAQHKRLNTLVPPKQRRPAAQRDPMRVGKMSPSMAKALEVADDNKVMEGKIGPAFTPGVLVPFDDLAVMPSNVDKIPAFLDRGNPVVAEEMTAARKAQEAEARKKMPLSGRAAMDAVKSPPRKRTKSDKA
jgi:hypothetical protein